MDEALTQSLYELFITPRNLIIVAMSWALAVMVGKIIPDGWRAQYKSHIVPLLHLLVCSSAVWISGLRPGMPQGKTIAGLDGEEIGFRISLGIILALSAYVVPVFLMWIIEKKLPPGVAKALRKII